MGGVINQETAQAAGEFNDKLDDLRAIALGIGLNIAREVLPAIRDLVDWLSKLGEEGSDSAKVFEWIGREAEADVKFIKDTTTAVRELIAIVEGLGRAAAGSWEVTKNLFTLGGASGTYLGGWKKFLGGLKDAADVATMSDAEFLASRDGASSGSARAGTARRGGGAMRLDRVSGTETSQARIKALEEQIREFLEGNGKDNSRGSKLKSDADKLAESFSNLLSQQEESIALFGQQGEAAKIAYQLANSELKNLTDSQKQQLLDNAKWQDFQQEMADIEQAWADAAEDAADARRKHQKAIEDVNAYLDEQIALLGKSAEEQEAYNLAAQAGVSIDSEAGRVIAEKVSQLYDQAEALRDQTYAMDALRDAGSDFFTDWISGAKSFKDAALDALDSLNKRILQMIADNLMEKLFGEFGTTGTGSTARTAGGGWGQAIGSFIGSIFGGARAGGGDVWGNRAYLVGEQGPEMFVPNTAGTIIPAGRTAAMTRGGDRVQQINNFTINGRIDRRTEAQIVSEVGRKTNVALRRNGPQ